MIKLFNGLDKFVFGIMLKVEFLMQDASKWIRDKLFRFKATKM